MAERMINVAVRLPPDMVAGLDAFASRMTSDNHYPGVQFSRSDAARALLLAALAREANDNAPKSAGKAGRKAGAK